MVDAILFLCLVMLVTAAPNATNEEADDQPTIVFLEDNDTESSNNSVAVNILDNRDNEIEETATALVDLTRSERDKFGEQNFQSTRRFLQWLKGILQKKQITTSTEPTITTTVVPDMEPTEVQKFLVAILINLTQVIEKLNANLDTLKSLTPSPTVQARYTRANTVDYFDLGTNRRPKRDISAINGEKIKNSHEVYNNASVLDKNESNITAISGNTTEATPDFNTITNSTSLINNKVEPLNPKDDESNKCKPGDGRRNIKYSNPEVRKKLISYTEDAFRDIANKIGSVKKIKYEYVNNEYYKIGYIVANIDTLEANIANLKNDMDNHKETWDENKLIEMFDKLIISNKVVNTLVDSLNIMEIRRNRANQIQSTIPKDHQVLPLFRNA